LAPPSTSNAGMLRLRHLADSAGMLASALCLLHCLALPALLLFFPLTGLGGDSEMFHAVMVGLACAAALTALGPGYLAHRRLLVAVMGGAGLACLASGVFVFGPRYGEPVETALTVAGAVLLTLAHLRNRVCCRACGGQ
jgi:hypothetical protein